MCRFIETIRIENGEICNLPCHERRVADTWQHFWGGAARLNLGEVLSGMVPHEQGLFKARIVYDRYGLVERSCDPYTMRSIKTLQMVCGNQVDYTYKSENREVLNSLGKKKGHADEILIVRNGMVTDTAFTNVAFFDGNEWLTPESPLLCGTMRAKLLEEKRIRPCAIHVDDISRYQSISLFNAMIDLGKIVLPVSECHD
ncbi:MAG: aminotransferase class IV [Prevotella sp.]|nr:aminotransferase class IV [Prevotella sp.]